MTWFYQHTSGDAYYNDVELSACAWLRELMIAGEIAPGVIDNRSILKVQPADLIGFTQCHFFAGIGGWSLALRLAGWPDDRPVWTGSPPCQPFSVAGQNKGKDDERHLAPHFIGLVRACRPRVLLGEQVASSAVFGKVAKGRRGSTKGAPEWAWIDDLSDRLEAARYAAWAVDFPSAGVGAPHIRQRSYFGAVDTLRLADAASPRSLPGAQPGIHRCEESAGPRNGESERRVATERLADDSHGCDKGRGRIAATGGDGVERDGSACRVVNGVITGLEGQRRDGDDRDQPGRLDQAAIGPIAEASAVDWLADCASGGRGEERQDGGGGVGGDSAQGQPAGLGAGGGDFGVADADGTTGRENARGTPCDENAHGAAGRDRGEPDTDHRFASDGENRRASTSDSFWSDADWLFCRDGKWRPVEPGTFPLAHGVSGRVGLLRGYGNAINPQQAAVFVEESARTLAEAEPFRLTSGMATDKQDIFG